ncbi:MAG: hypothetical protein ACLFTQ_00340 [Candidatus Aenigmatarchaeota archaeon]
MAENEGEEKPDFSDILDLEYEEAAKWMETGYRTLVQRKDISPENYLKSVFEFMCMQKVQDEMGKEVAHENPQELNEKGYRLFKEELEKSDDLTELIRDYSEELGEEDTRFSVMYAIHNYASGILSDTAGGDEAYR